MYFHSLPDRAPEGYASYSIAFPAFLRHSVYNDRQLYATGIQGPQSVDKIRKGRVRWRLGVQEVGADRQ